MPETVFLVMITLTAVVNTVNLAYCIWRDTRD